jgi:hypothetical protein
MVCLRVEILCVLISASIPVLLGPLFPFGIFSLQNIINLGLEKFYGCCKSRAFPALKLWKLLGFPLELFNSITKFPLAPPGKGLLAVGESSLYSKYGITSQHAIILRGFNYFHAFSISGPAIFKFKSTMIGLLLYRVVIVRYLDRTMVRGSGSKSNHWNLLETCTPLWVRHFPIQPLFCERIIMPSVVPCKLGPIVSQIKKLALL